MNVIKLLLRPGVTLAELAKCSDALQFAIQDVSRETLEQVEIQLKYETYIEKEKEMALKANALEDAIIPDQFDYDKVKSLSTEGRQKFKKIQPRTLGQAGRISG